MQNATAEEQDGRAGVQSVEIGLRVARVFVAAVGPMALKDVARAAGLGASATHRYLVSLVRGGLVVQGGDGRYDLGPLALQLGFAGLARVDAVDVCARHLRTFVDATGTTGMLSVWSDRGPLVVRWLQGVRAVFTTIAVGSVLPADRSATGRAFLAFGAGAMDANLENVREAGMATISGDLVPGLFAVAVPVFDGTAALAAVLTAVSAGEPVASEAAVALRRAGHAASAALGFRDEGAVALAVERVM